MEDWLDVAWINIRFNITCHISQPCSKQKPSLAPSLSEQINHPQCSSFSLPWHSVHLTVMTLSHCISDGLLLTFLPWTLISSKAETYLRFFFFNLQYLTQFMARQRCPVSIGLKNLTLSCPYKFNQTAWQSRRLKDTIACDFCVLKKKGFKRVATSQVCFTTKYLARLGGL